ncbi:alpha/beta hydrolase [Lentibacter algarum]|uniref:alpha/beta fold hydrolase n=1 Tax=Lentibacter algarum TaxID=576131 RepID=UPI001C066A86|nr:alpha/beta hydrolase [Lentibacter algarum]MBU2980955.1 alpha/beta hydrolase [Lentibacter algarum]
MTVENRAGYDVYHTVLGEGPRKALMLHCSLAHSGAWRGVAKLLGDEATMTAFDHLSHGKTAVWDGVGDYHDVSTEVAKTFLKTGEKIDLVGHSFGATVALRLALECPDMVRSAVLIEPVLFAIARLDDPEYAEIHLSEMKRISDFIDAGDTAAAAQSFLGIWGGGPPWEAMPESMQKMMEMQIPLIPESEPAIYRDLANMTDETRLAALDMPVMLLRGSTSPKGIKTVNDGLARRMGGAENLVVEGAGHMVPITHPKETAELIRAFWLTA